MFFSGRGCMPGEINLQVDSMVQPVIVPPHGVPLSMQSKLKNKLERLENEQVIMKVEQPTDWCSNLACVEKTDGTLQLCIHPQPLNVVIKCHHYPLPVVEDVLPDLEGVEVFSKADFNKGRLPTV